MIDCEKNLIGTVINFPDLIENIIHYENLFQTSSICEIWDIIKKFKTEKKKNELLQAYIIDNTKYLDEYLKCINDAYIESNFDYYLEQVLTNKMIRDIQVYSTEMKGKSYLDILSDIDAIVKSNEIISNNDIVKASDICQDILENPYEKKIVSNIDFIDDKQGGFALDEFIIIPARPSTGKTSKMIDLIKRDIRSKLSIGVATCEMKESKIIKLLAGNMSGVDVNKWDMKMLKKEEEARFIQAMEKIYDSELYLTQEHFFEKIVMNYKMMVKKYGIKKFYIDHMHHISKYQKFASTIEFYMTMMLTFKAMARQYGVPIILLAQLNRESDKGEGRRPRKEDIKWCGDAEQIADIVVLLHTKHKAVDGDFSRRIIELIIDKNRNGEVGSEWQEFYSQCRRFERTNKY
jgi:replicative DNA helicase